MFAFTLFPFASRVISLTDLRTYGPAGVGVALTHAHASDLEGRVCLACQTLNRMPPIPDTHTHTHTHTHTNTELVRLSITYASHT